MAKRSRTKAPISSAAAKPEARHRRAGIIHTSLYLPEAVHSQRLYFVQATSAQWSHTTFPPLAPLTPRAFSAFAIVHKDLTPLF